MLKTAKKTANMWILFGVFGMIFASINAEGAERPLYSARGKRDPFVQLVTLSSRQSAGLISVESIDEIMIEGMVYDVKDSIVIVNGSVMKEGDEMGNVKVIQIRPDGALFSVNGVESFKPMYQEENKKK